MHVIANWKKKKKKKEDKNGQNSILGFQLTFPELLEAF